MENSRFKIKPTVSFYQDGNKVYFKTAGLCTEIIDEEGVITKLRYLLDGKNNVKHIFEQLHKEYPQVAYQDIVNILTALNDAYFLEQADDPAGLLSSYELTRWSRNINFFGSYCKADDNKFAYQHKLQNTKVTLLGVGGLGTHILFDLAALGVKDILAVDFDKIELSNLNRQILYTEADIGRVKVEAAKERIKQFNSYANIEFVCQKLSSAEDIEPLIADRDIVICVADKPRMQVISWLNEACVKKNISFINGGLDVQRALFYSVIPHESGCVECWRTNVNETDLLSKMILNEDTKRDVSTGIPDPAIVTLVSTLTGLMLCEFIKLATGITKPMALGKLYSFQFDTLQLEIRETWSKNPACKICSK